MFSILELQRELWHPKMAQKVSGLLRNGPLGSIPCPRHHVWVDFWGSHLYSERFFPGYSGFPLSSKRYINKYRKLKICCLLNLSSKHQITWYFHRILWQCCSCCLFFTIWPITFLICGIVATPLLAITCEGTRLHRKLMQCNEKLIELIIHWIHCENIWNNDHDNHKNKEVTCTFTSVSGFFQIQHGGFLILFVVIVALRANYADCQ